jgi:hypothetical protein
MTRFSARLVAVALGCAVGLSACADRDRSYDDRNSTQRAGNRAPGPYDCDHAGCGESRNVIPGTNADVGPGPPGEEWHKGPRE